MQHQRNVLRIEELKRVAQENDDRIKTHFRAVAELRKELTAIPSTGASEGVREVGVDELLEYARFISPTTVPPSFRRKDLPQLATKAADDGATKGVNGIATPPSQPTAPDGEGGATGDSSADLASQALTEPEKAYLNPTNLPFAPWPEPLVIGNGALGQIQRMVEAGRDPASVLSPEEALEAARRKAEEAEREKAEEEEMERRRRAIFDEGSMGRGGGRGRGVVEDDVFDPDA